MVRLSMYMVWCNVKTLPPSVDALCPTPCRRCKMSGRHRPEPRKVESQRDYPKTPLAHSNSPLLFHLLSLLVTPAPLSLYSSPTMDPNAEGGPPKADLDTVQAEIQVKPIVSQRISPNIPPLTLRTKLNNPSPNPHHPHPYPSQAPRPSSAMLSTPPLRPLRPRLPRRRLSPPRRPSPTWIRKRSVACRRKSFKGILGESISLLNSD